MVTTITWPHNAQPFGISIFNTHGITAWDGGSEPHLSTVVRESVVPQPVDHSL